MWMLKFFNVTVLFLRKSSSCVQYNLVSFHFWFICAMKRTMWNNVFNSVFNVMDDICISCINYLSGLLKNWLNLLQEHACTWKYVCFVVETTFFQRVYYLQFSKLLVVWSDKRMRNLLGENKLPCICIYNVFMKKQAHFMCRQWGWGDSQS